jgi:hypothetical protein
MDEDSEKATHPGHALDFPTCCRMIQGWLNLRPLELESDEPLFLYWGNFTQKKFFTTSSQNEEWDNN